MKNLFENLKKIKNGKFTLLWLALLSIQAMAAEKIYMPYFDLINVHADYQYSTARLFKTYVEEEGRYQLVLPPRPAELVPMPPIDSVQAICRAAGYQKFIIGEFNRIGERVNIKLSLYKTEDKSLVWVDHLKAATPEDIDPILQKVARAIGTEKKAAEEGDIYSVTLQESSPLRQVKTTKSLGVAVGGAVLPGEDFRNNPFAAGAGIYGAYDARNYLFEIDGFMYNHNETHLSFFSISGYKLFFPRNVTPFAGGGMGLMNVMGLYKATTNTGTMQMSSTTSGLMMYVGGGLLMNRTSNVQFRLHGRYFIGAFTMDNPDENVPHGLLVNVSLAFGR